MASAIIHLAIAKEIRKKISVQNLNEKDYYLGAIAPDISKQIGLSKEESHFLINTRENVPNIDIFTKRYPKFKYNSFDLGYFTHLYADKLWFEEFLPTISENNSIKLLDGTIIQTTPEEVVNMIYSDYTNINTEVIEKYDMDLSLFYEDFIMPKTEIKEIPIEQLDILINQMGILIENSKSEKKYTFDIYIIDNFIQHATEEIIKELNKY